MRAATAAAVAGLPGVRWVGPYEPVYRLEPELVAEYASGAPVQVRKYNMVMADKRNDKDALQRKIEAIGGEVADRHEGGLLFTAHLTFPQLLQAARFDEVLWIDRWTESGVDMDKARTVQGSNHVESVAGYTGSGVRGHVYEGVEAGHSDFTTPMTNVRSGGFADDHGHCTAGCIFGNGTSHANARGHAPAAVGFYTDRLSVTAGWSRNMVIGDVVNVHNCMFTTASWGAAQTTAYTSVSADADDIVFDHRIPWTNSQSNTGNQNSRPEAWAKNVISVGALRHYDNTNVADDLWASWPAGGLPNAASIGPAADGRLKPDLCNFYDDIHTSDRTGAAGYSAGNSNTAFGGTSGATPVTAGLNALAIQMYTDHILNNTPRVVGGTRFQNRPYAQTLKALQIACASIYPVAQATRAQAGWGYANVRTVYDRRNRLTIIPEDVPITQGSTHTYLVNVLTGETQLKICMTYLDPAGNVAAAIDRINDLTLRVIHPNGTTSYWGNVGLTTANTSSTGGAANTIDTVECVFVDNPTPGNWKIEITAPTIAEDAHLATPATDATYALVVNGGIRVYGSGCARHIPDNDAGSGTLNFIPFGGTPPSTLTTVFASNNSGSVGGAIYFDLTAATNLYLSGLDVNTATTVGTPIIVDVFTRSGTYAGNENTTAGWSARTTGHGVAAALNTPSSIQFNDMIPLGAGLTTGVAIVARNFDHRYTNGANVYSNANLSFSGGSATNVPFSGAVFSPRTANMTFQYRTDNHSWTNQLYQQILRREQLGSAGTITGLAFAPGSTGRQWNRQLRIRMSHVAAGYTLSNTFAANLPAPVTVLDKANYSWHMTADRWTEVGLTSAFAYNGTSDVVVEVLAVANNHTSPAAYHRATEPRLHAFGWLFGSPPATGTVDAAAQKIRANFNCAEAGVFGTRCGPMRTVPFSTPVAGTGFFFDILNAVPGSAAIMVLGLHTNAPYPVDLTPFGWTNCRLWQQDFVTIFHVIPPSGNSWHFLGIPPGTANDGTIIYGQWFNFDPAQPGGLSASEYIRMIVGQGNP
jgi:hypothetical protein